jgi:hypothetical protein
MTGRLRLAPRGRNTDGLRMRNSLFMGMAQAISRGGPLQDQVCVSHAADRSPGRNSYIVQLAGGRFRWCRRRRLALYRGRTDYVREW